MSYSLAITQAIEIMIYISVKMKNGHTEFLTMKHISEKLQIPIPSIKKILKHLIAKNLVITKEGIGGGILLNKSPDQISLLDIFTAIEDQKPLFKRSFIQSDNTEVQRLEAKMYEGLIKSEEAMKLALAKQNLADLIK